MSEHVVINGQSYVGERVAIINGSQQWSEFLLADGTVIRICAVLTKVCIVPQRSHEEGHPVYHWDVGFLHDVSIPPQAPKEGNANAG